jgi:hypothetical protein
MKSQLLSLLSHSRLRLVWGAVVLLLCVAAGAIALGIWWKERNEQALKQAEIELRNRRSALSQAQLQAQMNEQATGVYLALKARGFFAAEDRQTIIERLSALKEKHELNSLRIVLARQAPVQLSAASPLQTLKPYASRFSFVATAAHEGKLLRFIEELPTQVAGVLRPQRCEIAQVTDDAAVIAASQRAVQMTCQFELFTARES